MSWLFHYWDLPDYRGLPGCWDLSGYWCLAEWYSRIRRASAERLTGMRWAYAERLLDNLR